MMYENPNTPAWGLSGPTDLPVSWGYEKGVRGAVRVSDKTAEDQAELYNAVVAAAGNQVNGTAPDTLPDMADLDRKVPAPVSPAPEGAAQLAVSEAVAAPADVVELRSQLLNA